MKNINDKTAKWLIVSGGILISVVLIILINGRFQKEPIIEQVVPETELVTSEVKVEEVKVPEPVEKTEVIVEPIETTAATIEVTAAAVGAEVNQAIQEDIPEKPTYTEEQLADPTQTPNGEKVEPPKEVTKPTTTETVKPETTTTTKPAEQKTTGGLPGFENVPDGGANQVIEATDMYENGNKVGEMN